MKSTLTKAIFLILIFGFIFIQFGCIPRDESNTGDIYLDVNDPDFMNVVDAEVNQDPRGLLSHLKEVNPSLRYKAILAFASFQDSTIVDSLVQYLQDPVIEIREAASYTLGQLGKRGVVGDLQNAFVQKDTGSIDLLLNHNILEAIGKIGSEREHTQVSSISTYRDKDTNLLLGQARAIYRFALRGITSQKSTDKMANMVLNPKMADKVRTVAANYLARARDIDISGFKHQLIRQLSMEKNVNVKMAIALAMQKERDPELVDPLLSVLNEAKDYRVKCNLLRALESYDGDSLRTTVFNSLLDDNPHVATAAANHFIKGGNADEVPFYREFLKQDLKPKARANMMQAILTQVHPYFTKTREYISNRTLQEYNKATTINDKKAYIAAMSADVKNYQMIGSLLLREESPVLQSSLMQGLLSIIQNKKLSSLYITPADKRYTLRYMARTVEAVMRKGDIGSIALGSEILNDRDLNLKDIGRLDFAYIDTIRQAIALPEGLEAYNALVPAANYLLDTTFTMYKTNEVQKLNWSLIQDLKDSSFVKIITNKGDIDFRFFTAEAPATVANFVRLANENFYDNKNFHRVVPNFVVQGGCTIGDGYGSPPYNIRSEFAPLYYDSEGMVGMASAGPHTESAQFFITHSPAMHLDGKYTIFGKVIRGMDVVHSIQEGDIIEDVQIRND